MVERGAEAAARLADATAELGGTHFTGALYSALGKYDQPVSAGGRANVVAGAAGPGQGGGRRSA